MFSLRRAMLYGFLIWLLTLVISMMLFPLKTSWPVLFDSIMPVVLAIFTVIFANRFFQSEKISVIRGGLVGIIWMVMNLLLDLPLFSFGPMQMRLAAYIADIGLTYLIIPILTLGMAALAVTATTRISHATNNTR